MTLADFGSFTSINGSRDVPCRDKVLQRFSVSLDGDDQLMDHRAWQSESSAPPSGAPMKNMEIPLAWTPGLHFGEVSTSGMSELPCA